MCQTLDWGIRNSRLASVCWLLRAPDKVSRTRLTVLAEGLSWPVRFAVHRQPLCWNFLYHSRTVLSVGGSVRYLVRNFCWTVTVDSGLANSKTKNAFLSPVLAMFCHDWPLAVKPAGTPRRLMNLERFYTYWYAPFCCVCLDCCCPEFGSSWGTYELPCSLGTDCIDSIVPNSSCVVACCHILHSTSCGFLQPFFLLWNRI
jgi:hypothetical protein